MKLKESMETMQALKSTIERAEISPSVLLCDNGNEFKGEFIVYAERMGIKINNTPTYTAEANALVKRQNLEIRKLVRAYILTKNNLNWIGNLQAIEDNRNNTYNSSIKTTPNTIWSSDKNKIELARVLPDRLYETTNRRKEIARSNALRLTKKNREV